ncbi:hypothetical protein P6U16_22660 (plasmid) [Rhizobium sp. 32-5/1]|uniref:DUF6894 family protein n=1 Tax=Rhizobium sp. 32-5/1 TaxID=3019602 RepID=UPI00240D657B|nr:hypothetical protein [Rhizobium sp. 32-5/1]WEZ85821.1 hypothetical protein P6U16_22660 [Rhizobium sp. 32-5/1]
MTTVHFVFDDGLGVQPDGLLEFQSLDHAKRKAIKALAEMMHEMDAQPGVAAMAGNDEYGKALFTISLQVTTNNGL